MSVKEILRVFGSDIGSIVKHFPVLLIIIGIIVLPSLYAWINIYASFDPYVNTKHIPVAVASKDAGIKLADGSYENAASEVEAELKDDETVDWQIIDSAEEAVEGVRSGEYYAAVIFEKNFTYNMNHLREALEAKDPSITYYSNTKKNAVAAKITDSAAESLEEKINTKYLEGVFKKAFKDTNQMSDEVESEDVTENALKQLRETRDALGAFSTAIRQMSSTGSDVRDSLNKAEKTLDKARSKGDTNLAKAEESIDAAYETIKELESDLKENLKDLDTALEELNEAVSALLAADDDAQREKLAADAEKKAGTVLDIEKKIRALIPTDSKAAAARITCDTVDIMILGTEEIIDIIREDPIGNAEALTEAVQTMATVRVSELAPEIDSLISDFERAIKTAEPLLSITDGLLDNIDPVLNSAEGAVGSLDSTNGRMLVVIESLMEEVDDIIEQVEAADEKDRMSVLKNLMGADPNTYSKFFSSLVHVKKTEVYSVRSYGAAMTPFYTVLAIWVGGVILAGLLTTVVNREKFPHITEPQSYFGRLLIFLLLGQLQTAVIVAGDIFLLGCEPEHPWLMWIASAITSLVFVMFIYSLVFSFGIIGKAAMVVIMVMQIAGSSGSYPIEILPAIFGKVYKFFPFPYAINAMRESICGTYGNDFVIYLAELLIFILCALAIGLLIRKPFIGVTRYITEKLEETEVL